MAAPAQDPGTTPAERAAPRDPRLPSVDQAADAWRLDGDAPLIRQSRPFRAFVWAMVLMTLVTAAAVSAAL